MPVFSSLEKLRLKAAAWLVIAVTANPTARSAIFDMLNLIIRSGFRSGSSPQGLTSSYFEAFPDGLQLIQASQDAWENV